MVNLQSEDQLHTNCFVDFLEIENTYLYPQFLTPDIYLRSPIRARDQNKHIIIQFVISGRK